MYGAIHVVREHLDSQQTSFPFIVSSHFDGKKVVYGTVQNLIKKTARLIFRLEQWHRDLDDSIPSEVKSRAETEQEFGATVVRLPELDYSESVLQLQEEKLEETILLTSLHVRTLFEIFSGKGDIEIVLYDYEDKQVGKMSLHEITNLLMHHRYFVVDGNYVRDLFSGKEQLASPRLLGSKFTVTDLFNAMLAFLTGIRIRDYVGVLRTRLEQLTASSEPRDFVFLIQNIHMLSNIVQERFQDSRFHKVMELLFRDVYERHLDGIREAGVVGEWNYQFKFGKPEFKIDDELSRKSLVMSIMIDGDREEFRYSYEEFFDVLTRVYGNEPLLSIEQLRNEVSQDSQ